MARKRIGKFLSGGVLILCIVLFYAPRIHASISGEWVTHTISGNVGVSGVEMTGFQDGSVLTDNNGYYSATVKYGWSGTIIPRRRGYEFTPQTKSYSKVTGDLLNEDYIGTVVTYTISGSTGMPGVEMNGLPGNPVTTEGGMYSVNVDYGWSGTVNPTKEGYTFDPPSQTYGAVTANQMNQNYKYTQITFPIAGNVGTAGAGVIMKGLPGDPTTGRDGNYSVTVKYGFAGVVTPQKEGWEFSPPSMQYNELVSAQTSQDYYSTQITYLISGSAGMQGVEMAITGDNLPTKPVTDENGYFNIVVPHGWGGTITPQRAGFTFKPASFTIAKLTQNRENVNFEPTVIQLTVSGSAGLDGVEMSGLPNNPVTTSGGLYSATVDYGWDGTVTPYKEGYNFNPPSKSFSLISRDQLNQNFTPSKQKFEISGVVTPAVSGVLMKGLPGNPTTGTDGSYTATVDYGFTGSATPVKEGYEFDPSSRPYTEIVGPEYNQNYMATLLKRTLSGIIISDKGQPVEGVMLTAGGDGGGTAMTNNKGEYQLEVDYGWRGIVTPEKEGYTFKEPKKQYGSVIRDQPNQSFTAILKTFTIKGTIIVGGTPVEGVKVTATNEGGADTTDSKGEYSVTVPYNWTGEVIPEKEGIRFNPPSTLYASVTTDHVDGNPVQEQRALPRPQQPTQPPRQPITQPQQPDTSRDLPKPGPQRPATDEVTGLPMPGQPILTTKDAGGLPRPEPQEPSIIDTTVTGGTQTPINMETIKDAIREQLRKEQAAGVTGGTGQPGQLLVTNNFNDETLDSTLRIIGALVQFPIILDEEVTANGIAYIINCNLENEPLDRALEIVLAGTPYVVKKTPYYYLVCLGTLDSPMFPSVSETHRIKLNYVRADMAMNLLSTAFQNYVKAEPGGNTLVVTGPPVLIERIKSDLAQIDQVPAQVLLDARIVVIERGDLLNLGVEWGWPRIQAGVFSNNLKGVASEVADFGGKSAWGVQIGYAPDGIFTSSLELALNLLAQNNEARILTKPQVFAQDGKKAEIRVTKEEYFILTSPQVTSVYAYSEMQQIDTGTVLTITPYIGDNNDITLEMAVEVSDSVARGPESELPVVTRRTASNTVRIKDGGTVAVAGLSENKSTVAEQRVPGLSKLPLIGPLFENNNRQNSTREIAVFVTARIVPESYSSSQTYGFANETQRAFNPPTYNTPTYNAPNYNTPNNYNVPRSGSVPGAASPGAPVNPEDQGFRESLRDSLNRSNSYR